MTRLRSLVPAVAMMFCALTLAGCPRTPQSLCQEYVDAMNAMFDRCGIVGGFVVVHPRTGEQGCHIVQQVRDPDPIVDECIPWANEIDTEDECAMVDPSMLPSFCSASVFEIVE